MLKKLFFVLFSVLTLSTVFYLPSALASSAPAPVPQTGQTVSYQTGDDGDVRAGVAWPDPRFTDNDNGTVTDNLTGLIWLKNANCFGTKNWAAALTEANGLASGSCDLTDSSTAGQWRLPSVRELKSLVDHGQSAPALPLGHPFSNVQANTSATTTYVTSTTHAYDTTFAWRVNMYNGIVENGFKTSGRYVWPVRSGQ